MPISARQTKLLDSMRDENGKIVPGLKSLAENLKKFAFKNEELDLIEKELDKTSLWQGLAKRRAND